MDLSCRSHTQQPQNSICQSTFQDLSGWCQIQQPQHISNGVSSSASPPAETDRYYGDVKPEQISGPVQKPTRTVYSVRQISILTQEFSKRKYISRLRRIELAQLLQLTEKQIMVWFVKKRTQYKREDQSAKHKIQQRKMASSNKSQIDNYNSKYDVLTVPLPDHEFQQWMSSMLFNSAAPTGPELAYL